MKKTRSWKRVVEYRINKCSQQSKKKKVITGGNMSDWKKQHPYESCDLQSTWKKAFTRPIKNII
jgi:hypothetical protein